MFSFFAKGLFGGLLPEPRPPQPRRPDPNLAHAIHAPVLLGANGAPKAAAGVQAQVTWAARTDREQNRCRSARRRHYDAHLRRRNHVQRKWV